MPRFGKDASDDEQYLDEMRHWNHLRIASGEGSFTFDT